jgi:hypothetical protein
MSDMERLGRAAHRAASLSAVGRRRPVPAPWESLCREDRALYLAMADAVAREARVLAQLEATMSSEASPDLHDASEALAHARLSIEAETSLASTLVRARGAWGPSGDPCR